MTFTQIFLQNIIIHHLGLCTIKIMDRILNHLFIHFIRLNNNIHLLMPCTNHKYLFHIQWQQMDHQDLSCIIIIMVMQKVDEARNIVHAVLIQVLVVSRPFAIPNSNLLLWLSNIIIINIITIDLIQQRYKPIISLHLKNLQKNKIFHWYKKNFF